MKHDMKDFAYESTDGSLTVTIFEGKMRFRISGDANVMAVDVEHKDVNEFIDRISKFKTQSRFTP